MIGLPKENEDSAVQTARKIANLSPDGVRIYPTVVVRDTALEDLWKSGKYTPLTVEKAVDICASIAQIFENANIPIIRMGLNPTEDLSGGDALAGAYHPAFGQLVAARRRLERLRDMFNGVTAKEISVYANPKAISEVAGHKGENKKILREEFDLKRISIFPDEELSYNEMRICENKQNKDV